MDSIKKHLNGFAAALAALDLIRRGVDPAEATSRLLTDLAGKDCLAAFSDKELRSLANKMSHAAQNMAKAVHATHAVFGEALENGDSTRAAHTKHQEEHPGEKRLSARPDAQETCERARRAQRSYGSCWLIFREGTFRSGAVRLGYQKDDLRPFQRLLSSPFS
jgi:hypothetical protein